MNKYQSFNACLRDLNASVERMIDIQKTAFPEHWSDEDRREMACKTLGIGDTE